MAPANNQELIIGGGILLLLLMAMGGGDGGTEKTIVIVPRDDGGGGGGARPMEGLEEDDPRTAHTVVMAQALINRENGLTLTNDPPNLPSNNRTRER